MFRQTGGALWNRSTFSFACSLGTGKAPEAGLHSGAFVTLRPFLHEEQIGDEGEAGEQDTHGPQHVTEEAGHLHTLIFGDGADHEVRGIPDVGHGTHEHGTGGDGGQGFGPVGHQMHGIAAGGVEEHQIGRGVVEERREDAGQPEEHGVHGAGLRGRPC